MYTFCSCTHSNRMARASDRKKVQHIPTLVRQPDNNVPTDGRTELIMWHLFRITRPRQLPDPSHLRTPPVRPRSPPSPDQKFIPCPAFVAIGQFTTTADGRTKVGHCVCARPENIDISFQFDPGAANPLRVTRLRDKVATDTSRIRMNPTHVWHVQHNSGC